ncbi:MAG: rhodanese-like domain-containing protein [Woeseiaceae bacterium]
MFKTLFLLPCLLFSSYAFSSPSLLVDVNWLEKNLTSSTIKIIDMSDDTQFQRFHIPGSTHLPYAAINNRNKKGVSLSIGKQNIIKVLGLLGVQTHHHIVIYDDMGGLHAARLFWELEKLGHKKISILNGGLVKWILTGKKVTASTRKVAPTQYKASNTNLNNTANLDDIINGKFNNKNILLDVRSKDEYVGHPRYPRTGHIPNAKWWEWQNAVAFDQAFTMQNEKTLRSQLTPLGLTNNDTSITLYCQSAHRASQSYFTLRQLGFKNIKIYDGSMSEYSKVKTAPLKLGLTP